MRRQDHIQGQMRDNLLPRFFKNIPVQIHHINRLDGKGWYRRWKKSWHYLQRIEFPLKAVFRTRVCVAPPVEVELLNAEFAITMSIKWHEVVTGWEEDHY